mmetsp:Transcript_91646/g.263749  ORF Transcript_91646/g.263749 Transcript_91646/m.263749 type:complete len:285 (+) Transcript_91646:153-1007(+)
MLRLGPRESDDPVSDKKLGVPLPRRAPSGSGQLDEVSRAARAFPTMSPRRRKTLLQELRQPLEAFGIAHALHHADHEELDGAHAGVVFLHLAAVGHMAVKAERVAELVFARRGGDVDLVPEHDERHGCERLVLEQAGELLPGLLEACTVCGVHEEDDAVDGGEVVLPDAARRLVASEIVRSEANVFDHQLFRVGMQGRHMCRHAVIFQHVQQRGLAGIVKPQEQDLRVLVAQAEVAQDIEEPIDEEHRADMRGDWPRRGGGERCAGRGARCERAIEGSVEPARP